MKASRVLASCLTVVLPLSLLMGQQSAKPQPPPAQRPSNGTLDLSFGPTASNPEGQAAAEKFLQALGGPAEVNAVKTMTENVVGMQAGERIEGEEIIAYPNKQVQKYKTAKGTLVLVVTPSDAFMLQNGQLRSLSDSQRTALDVSLKHDFINVLQHIHDPKYIFSSAGREQTRLGAAIVVDVEADGIPTRWWIGDDGKLLQERYFDTGLTGNVQIMTYADWKSYGGLQCPTKYELFNEAGQPLLSVSVTKLQVNPALPPSTFERPGR